MRTIHQERFYQRLLRWIHRCPRCNENSLLLGVQMGTLHICRSCRQRFTISAQTQVWKANEEDKSENNAATDVLLTV